MIMMTMMIEKMRRACKMAELIRYANKDMFHPNAVVGVVGHEFEQVRSSYDLVVEVEDEVPAEEEAEVA